MGRAMSNVTLVNFQSHPGRGANSPAGEESEYKLPRMPKLSLIININAAILAAILTVVFTIINQHKFIENIVHFSNLILCFAFGGIIAVMSCFFDYKARVIYTRAASKKRLIADVAETYDSCAFVIFGASLAIFAWGLYLTFYLVRNAFL